MTDSYIKDRDCYDFAEVSFWTTRVPFIHGFDISNK